MLAVDGMVEASKMYMQFYLAPELHAAYNLHIKEEGTLLCPAVGHHAMHASLHHVYAWETRFDRRGVYMLESGRWYIYIYTEKEVGGGFLVFPSFLLLLIVVF